VRIHFKKEIAKLMSIDVFDPNANKQKNSKYSNWREAAHDKPVNNNPNWRTDPTHKISNSDNVLKDLSKANREIKEYRNNSQVSTKRGADDSGLITARDEKILNQNKLLDQIRSEEFNAYKNRFKRRLENAGDSNRYAY
jgi:hypothetical protein